MAAQVLKLCVCCAFKELKITQLEHTKVRNIEYKKYEIQDYLVSGELSNREANMIAAIRANCVRGVRCNFRKQYRSTECPLECGQEDSQQHILSCRLLGNTVNASMDQLHEGNAEMKHLAKEYVKRMYKRVHLMEEKEKEMPPGATQDH